jgi:PST family polysaccharide transporter/lipopolysaccharide exporter
VLLRNQTLIIRTVRWLSSTEGPLAQRALRSGIWLVLADGITRIAGALKVVLLARLLAPRDFGLLGVAITVLSGFEYFTQTGFTAALIQRPGEIQSYLNTVWTVQMIRSAALAAAAWAAAPYAGWFFGSADVTPVLRAISLVTLIRGFGNPAVVYLRKELDFRRDLIWRQGGVAVSLALAVALAFVYRNVWALVISVIAGTITETVLSFYVMRSNRPRLQLDWRKVRELSRFGKWIFWSNAITYIGLYADSWVIGRFLGAVDLGYYQMAQQFGSRLTSQIGVHAAGVMLPAFSKLQDRADLRPAFLRSLRLVCIIVLPAGCFLTVFGDAIVQVLLGQRWSAIIPAMRILPWVGALTAIGGITTPLLQAKGRPELPLRALLLKVCVFSALFYPCLRKSGFAGVALAMVISGVANVGYQLLLTMRVVGVSGSDYIRAALPGIVVSFPPLAAGVLLHLWSPESMYMTTSTAIIALIVCGAFMIRELGSTLPSMRHVGQVASV